MCAPNEPPQPDAGSLRGLTENTAIRVLLQQAAAVVLPSDGDSESQADSQDSSELPPGTLPTESDHEALDPNGIPLPRPRTPLADSLTAVGHWAAGVGGPEDFGPLEISAELSISPSFGSAANALFGEQPHGLDQPDADVDASKPPTKTGNAEGLLAVQESGASVARVQSPGFVDGSHDTTQSPMDRKRRRRHSSPDQDAAEASTRRRLTSPTILGGESPQLADAAPNMASPAIEASPMGAAATSTASNEEVAMLGNEGYEPTSPQDCEEQQ